MNKKIEQLMKEIADEIFDPNKPSKSKYMYIPDTPANRKFIALIEKLDGMDQDEMLKELGHSSSIG